MPTTANQQTVRAPDSFTRPEHTQRFVAHAAINEGDQYVVLFSADKKMRLYHAECVVQESPAGAGDLNARLAIMRASTTRGAFSALNTEEVSAAVNIESTVSTRLVWSLDRKPTESTGEVPELDEGDILLLKLSEPADWGTSGDEAVIPYSLPITLVTDDRIY